MEHSIYKYILRHSKKQQIILLLLSCASFPFLYYYLELPKIIIDQAIQAKDIVFPVEFMDISIDQEEFLYVSVAAFLILVLINQGFKYAINVYQGITGERMLRRLRYELYSRIMRFPLPTFRKKSSGEIIPMITAEVEPLGGFIGEAFVLPAFQGGYLLVIMGFLLVQNVYMALAAIALYPLQAYFIPKMQRKVNLLGKERVQRVRILSDKIGETVAGIQEIHVHDASNLMRADFTNQLGRIYFVRYRIYLLKFVIKFLNNFIQQLGPFFFYAIGGTMVIAGNLEIGTLVAAINAHKEMAAPWKELLAYYQRREDARIKYEQVVEQFEPAGLRDDSYQQDEPDPFPKLSGELVGSNLILSDDTGSAQLEGLNIKVPLDSKVAIVGNAGSGRDALTRILARLIDPDKGNLAAGEVNLLDAPQSVTGRRISYIGQSGYVFNSTIGDNLFFGLKHRPLRELDIEDEDEKTFLLRDQSEIELTDNSPFNVRHDWIDYESAGVNSLEELDGRAIDVLQMVELGDDVYQFGLRSTLDPEEDPETAALILSARKRFFEKIENGGGLKNLVEAFEPDKYNTNATLGENLLFGTPVDESFDLERLAENTYVQKVIDEANLKTEFLKMGYQVASLMVELFADLPPDHEFFQQYGFISSDDLPEYQAILTRVNPEKLDQMREEDKLRFMSLPFKVIPSRHRLGVITEEIQEKIVKARKQFVDHLPDELKGSIAFFNPDEYNAAANIQDNILFGKIAYGYAQASEKIGALLSDVVSEMELKRAIIKVGLNFPVGSGGSRLSENQRQKLCIARSILKKPDFLVINQATASLDARSQQRILENILNEFEGRGVIWSLEKPELSYLFDQILLINGGVIADTGTFEDLQKRSEQFKMLIN
ncbi:ABC transporter transmembrane domain-containing protein [Sneathiella glossodoripedis]|uniref:ABC transporter transmembrane domain-containing protein n=1 Tax=Sneathiella glossodoripedis TaxID=418853 RepID=UPI000569FF9D|nr:ABC transporter transmembrane domain-containing protein [Sneathiella glossodoripedis]